MKKFKLLFLIPAVFAMVACNLGKGKEVTAEEAKDIAKNMQEVEEPKNMEISLSMTSYSAERKATSTASYTVKQNEAGDLYVGLKVETKDEKGVDEDSSTDMEIYRVADAEYDEVIYLRNYDFDKKQDEIEAYVKKGNEAQYAYMFESVDHETALVDAYTIPVEEFPDYIEEAELQAKADENISLKYYSNGKNNLTIEETIAKSDKEDAIWGSATITFDNSRLTKLESNQENAEGDKLNIKVEVKYPNSLKISLPNGWKDHIKSLDE